MFVYFKISLFNVDCYIISYWFLIFYYLRNVVNILYMFPSVWQDVYVVSTLPDITELTFPFRIFENQYVNRTWRIKVIF